MPGKYRCGKTGVKHRMSCGLNTGAHVACADNSGAKLLNVISVGGIHSGLNKLHKATIGSVVICSVKKGKPELRKKIVICVVIRQKKSWLRITGAFIFCEDNAVVLIKDNGDPKGTAISGPVAKECGEIF